MEENKRSVMVAALSAYVDLLAHNATQLNNTQGKGKGKASEEDVDLESEIQDQIKLCRDLSSSFANPSSLDDNQHDIRGDQVPDRAELDNQKLLSHNPFTSHAENSDDEELIFDPFTGRPIIRETGNEAGPSNRPQPRPPPPLRRRTSFHLREQSKYSSNPVRSLVDGEPIVDIPSSPSISHLTKPQTSAHESANELLGSPILSLSTTQKIPPDLLDGFQASPGELRGGLSRTDSTMSIPRKPVPGRHRIELLDFQPNVSSSLTTEATQNTNPKKAEGLSSRTTLPEYTDSSSIRKDKNEKVLNSSRVSSSFSVAHGDDNCCVRC